jgi:S-adenosylhomocysteine hydrolase
MHHARGRPREITALIAMLTERLEVRGWNAQVLKRGRSPLELIRWQMADEFLDLAVALPGPHRISRPSEYVLTVTGLVRDRDLYAALFSALPFTDLELEALRHDMPLTASVASRAADWISEAIDAQPLRGHAGIFTIHHQTDFVLLLEEALRLGIERDLVTVIDKEYRYRLSHRVDAHIQCKLGIPVYRYSEITAGLATHIRRVEQHRSEKKSEGWVPTLVVDDGGYVLPRLHDSFEPFLNLFKGTVEQTKSGIWKLRPFDEDHRMPVFSVAESELKATVEAQGVAQAALTSLRRLLPAEKFDGRRAVVVGFGTIGAALAELLRRQNVDVQIADSSPSKLVAARERGFQVSDNLPDLISEVAPRYIFSCAEPGAVGEEALNCVTRDCVLVSLTSRDVAFDKEALGRLFEPSPFGTVGTLYLRDTPRCRLLLLANGFPINFHFAESMPNQQSDLVMASLLAGAITLANADPPWPPGNDAQRANDVLNEGTLLHDFLTHEPGICPEIDDE